MRGSCLFCGKGEENESEIQMQLILAPSAGNEKSGGGGEALEQCLSGRIQESVFRSQGLAWTESGDDLASGHDPSILTPDF
jgi:hypothetical protein